MIKKGSLPQGLSQILDKITELTGEVDPGMADNIKKSMMGNLEKLKAEKNLKNLAVNIYNTAEEGFKEGLSEDGVYGDAQNEFLEMYRHAWMEMGMQRRSTEILRSPELAAMDGFISHIENLPKIKEVIESAEPMSRWEAILKGFVSRIPGFDSEHVNEYFGPVLTELGLGSLLTKKKKGEKPATKGGSAKREKPEANAAEPNETQESREVLKKPGATLFMGDSNTLTMTKVSKDKLKINGEIKEKAMKGEGAKWGAEEAERMAAQVPSPLKDFENAVVLFGSNDLLAYTPKQVTEYLKRTYKALKKAGVKNIYAVTIPPVGGHEGYDKAKERTWPNRHAINKWIKGTVRSGLVYRVIDLAAKEKDGGIADNEDPEKLCGKAGSGDGLHFSKELLASIYQRELEAGTNIKKT